MGTLSKAVENFRIKDNSSPSFVHCCGHSTVKGHQVGQAGLALDEAMPFVSNHLTVLHVP